MKIYAIEIAACVTILQDLGVPPMEIVTKYSFEPVLVFFECFPIFWEGAKEGLFQKKFLCAEISDLITPSTCSKSRNMPFSSPDLTFLLIGEF